MLWSNLAVEDPDKAWLTQDGCLEIFRFKHFYLIAKCTPELFKVTCLIISMLYKKYQEFPVKFLGKNIQDIVTSYRKSDPEY